MSRERGYCTLSSCDFEACHCLRGLPCFLLMTLGSCQVSTEKPFKERKDFTFYIEKPNIRLIHDPFEIIRFIGFIRISLWLTIALVINHFCGTKNSSVSGYSGGAASWMSWSRFQKAWQNGFCSSDFVSTKMEAVHEAREATICGFTFTIEAVSGFMDGEPF